DLPGAVRSLDPEPIGRRARARGGRGHGDGAAGRVGRGRLNAGQGCGAAAVDAIGQAVDRVVRGRARGVAHVDFDAVGAGRSSPPAERPRGAVVLLDLPGSAGRLDPEAVVRVGTDGGNGREGGGRAG